MNAISSSVNKGAFKVAPKAAVRRPRRTTDKPAERAPSATPERGESVQPDAPAIRDESHDAPQTRKRLTNSVPVVSSVENSIQRDPTRAPNLRKRGRSQSIEPAASVVQTNDIHIPTPERRSKRSSASTPALENASQGIPSQPEDITSAAEANDQEGRPRKPRKTTKIERPASAIPLPGTPEENKSQRKRATTRRKKREPTPELAELEEIDVTETRMLDLCRDLHKGRKSSKYEQLKQIAAERRRQQRLLLAANQQPQDEETIKHLQEELAMPEPIVEHETTDLHADEDAEEASDERYQQEAATTGAPQVRVVDGQIVLDVGSLQVDRTMRDGGGEEDGTIQYVEENPLERSVNSGTYAKRSVNTRWDAYSTELFYSGLSQWGTDFDMISRMFPNRNRKQIKNKFTIEERRNPSLVNQALIKKTPVDMAEYSRMAATDYKSVSQLQTELAELTAQFETEREEAIREAEERKREAMEEEEQGDANMTTDAKNKKKRKMSRKEQMDAGLEIVGDIDEIEAAAAAAAEVVVEEEEED